MFSQFILLAGITAGLEYPVQSCVATATIPGLWGPLLSAVPGTLQVSVLHWNSAVWYSGILLCGSVEL